MDKQNGPTAVEKAADTAAGVAGAARDTIGQATAKVHDLQGSARQALEQGRSAVADASDAALDMARRARDQAGAAADTLQQQGRLAGEYVSRNVEENPFTALLIAGIIGYGLSFLFHRR